MEGWRGGVEEVDGGGGLYVKVERWIRWTRPSLNDANTARRITITATPMTQKQTSDPKLCMKPVHAGVRECVCVWEHTLSSASAARGGKLAEVRRHT